MESEQEKILIGKLRVVKNYFEKTYVTGASCLWLIATFWDIYKLQRYWFDYALELYTSFLVLLMMIYSIFLLLSKLFLIVTTSFFLFCLFFS